MKSLLALGFSASSAACVWLLLLSLLYVPCGKGDEGEGNAVSECDERGCQWDEE